MVYRFAVKGGHFTEASSSRRVEIDSSISWIPNISNHKRGAIKLVARISLGNMMGECGLDSSDSG